MLLRIILCIAWIALLSAKLPYPIHAALFMLALPGVAWMLAPLFLKPKKEKL